VLPDRFLVGLATLTLITDAALERPVLCLIDDVQWLGRASAEVPGFVARRLFADRAGMLFAVRDDEQRAMVFEGIPELAVGGLPDEAAGELLARTVGRPLDQRVGRQIVAEAAGNPLALVEFRGELTAGEISGTAPPPGPLRFRRPGSLGSTGRWQSFRGRSPGDLGAASAVPPPADAFGGILRRLDRRI
jgi:hypothetical protein